MLTVWDVRPVKTILADCRDMRRQAREFPLCAGLAIARLRHLQMTLEAIRINRAALRQKESLQ